MQIFFKSRESARKLAKSGKLVDNGSTSASGKRWAVRVDVKRGQ